jgi:hypothetical protein
LAQTTALASVVWTVIVVLNAAIAIAATKIARIVDSLANFIVAALNIYLASSEIELDHGPVPNGVACPLWVISGHFAVRIEMSANEPIAADMSIKNIYWFSQTISFV